MKVDEVSGIQDVPQIRQGEVARETELQRQNVEPPTPPDQVEISQAARFAPETNQPARVEKLRQQLQEGGAVNSQKIAQGLEQDGVVQ